MWDGSDFKLKELVGFTVTSDQMIIPTAIDGSITNELQTLSTSSNTVTLSNSGGSFTIAGTGTNNVTTSGTTITVAGTEVDGNVNNEGLLGVTTATSNSSRITSNSTLANGVEIIANSPLSISETTSANGGTITLGISLPDNSNTNEGQLTISPPGFGIPTISSNTAGSNSIKVAGKDK